MGVDVYLRLLQKKIKGVEILSEYKFHPQRKWRFDYAIPELKIAVEIDGAVWVYGRHNHPKGYIADMEKLNNAASLGWLVLRFTTDEQYSLASFNLIASTVAFRRGDRS